MSAMIAKCVRTGNARKPTADLQAFTLSSNDVHDALCALADDHGALSKFSVEGLERLSVDIFDALEDASGKNELFHSGRIPTGKNKALRKSKAKV